MVSVADQAGRRQEENEVVEGGASWGESLWWYPTLVFPALAGTFGPIASALSICSMIRPWLLGSAPSTSSNDRSESALLIANTVQVSVALAVNLVLLLNMVRRIRFSVAQPVTIAGWYISSFTLTALAAAGPQLLARGRQAGNLEWSQAYYYCIYAAAAYFVVASLMLASYLVTPRGSSRIGYDGRSAEILRTLAFHTIIYLLHLLLGALVFSHIEGWAYLDAVYWAEATVLTIGLGDLAPATTAGRALLFPYAILGIISLGLILGAIRRLVLDRNAAVFHARRLSRMRDRYLREARRGSEQERQPLEQVYNNIRRIQSAAIRNHRWTAFAISLSTWLAFWFVGAAVFMICEAPYQSWTYFDGVYFAFTSLATIGYGDMKPVSGAGKSFFVLWTLLAVPVVTVLISNAQDTVARLAHDATIFLWDTALSLSINRACCGSRVKAVLTTLLPSRKPPPRTEADTGNVPRPISKDDEGHRSNQEATTRSRRKYQILLMDEIIRVIRDLEDPPPAGYSFERWMTFRELCGGYVSYRTCLRVRIRRSREHQSPLLSNVEQVKEGADWEASKSPDGFGIFEGGNPLAGPRDEVGSVLTRLTATLKSELAEMARQEDEEEGMSAFPGDNASIGRIAASRSCDGSPTFAM